MPKNTKNACMNHEQNADIKDIIRRQTDTDNFYLYDERIIHGNIACLQNSFPQIKFLYSIKCNSNKHVLRSIFRQGLGADAASAQEVLLANECGLTKNDIYYSAPGKTINDIQCVLDKAIIITDSINELMMIDKLAKELGRTIETGIRINPDFSFYSANAQASKFGIDEKQVIDFIKNKQAPHIKICGIHVHLKSQELNPLVLKKYYENVLDLAEKFSTICGELQYVNMGSGIGIQYTDTNTPLNVTELAASIKNKMTEFQSNHPDTLLMIETGRYIVGESGFYVTTVLDKKISRGKTFIILKNTLNGFIRPSLEQMVNHYSQNESPDMYEPLFSYKNAFKFLPLTRNASPAEKVTLAGNLCTALDIIAEDIELPLLVPGDKIMITNAGAYAAVLSPMQFASQEKPKELFAAADGTILE